MDCQVLTRLLLAFRRYWTMNFPCSSTWLIIPRLHSWACFLYFVIHLLASSPSSRSFILWLHMWFLSSQSPGFHHPIFSVDDQQEQMHISCLYHCTHSNLLRSICFMTKSCSFYRSLYAMIKIPGFVLSCITKIDQ